MSELGTSAWTGDAAILATHRSTWTPSPAQDLKDAAAQAGVGYGALVRSFARHAAGAGRVAFDDFVKLRLFDPAWAAPGPATAFLGARRNLQLCFEVNHRHEWFGMLTNKVASQRYLSGYGLPTIPISAVFMPGLASGGAGVLGDRRALERFLLDPGHYPLFGKPVEGFQSFGASALRSCCASARVLEQMDGTFVPLDAFVDEIVGKFAAGYLFQPLATPHPDVRALCGSRIATVRMVTILADDGPRLFRAAAKVPVGPNWADNFWRPGNILARVDAETGRFGSAVSGVGLRAREVRRHPDTLSELAGFDHPQWGAMRDLALDAARLMGQVPMIGWDIACTDRGPVIVEMNATPDMFLVQFADRRGVLDPAFRDFAAFQATRAKRRRAAQKARDFEF